MIHINRRTMQSSITEGKQALKFDLQMHHQVCQASNALGH